MAAHAVIAVRRTPNGHPDMPRSDRVAQPPAPGTDILFSVPGGPGSSMVVGDVSVEGSTDVLFDNVTVFEGPVTVQQVRSEDGLPPKSAKDAEAGGGDYEEEGQTCGMGPCAFRWALGILALALGIIVLAVLLATLLSGAEEEEVQHTTVGHRPAIFTPHNTKKADDAKMATPGNESLILVSRKEWGSKPPKAPPDPMTLPVPYVIVSHTATEHCDTFEDCAAVVRSVQGFHMGSRNWWDIGYNFLVGGDGRAYEGRGWDGVGAHARFYNNVSIGLSFIGTFSGVEPPQKQVSAAINLIKEGVKLGKISADYGLLGHRQVSPTESPGEQLFQMLKTWPHWTELES